MFAVTNIDDALARLQRIEARMVGEVFNTRISTAFVISLVWKEF